MFYGLQLGLKSITILCLREDLSLCNVPFNFILSSRGPQ